MGVTREQNQRRAWLVDIETNEREVGAVGDEVFGFRVQQIVGENVVLERAGDEYTLRLGEKSIPVTIVADDTDDAPTGFDMGSGRRGGRGNSGEQGRGGFRQRGGFGGSGGGARVSSGGGGRSATGGRNRSTSRNARNGGATRNAGNRFQASRRGSFGTNAMMGGRMGNFQGSSQFGSAATGSTSNPQTARRRGSQLIGGTVLEASPEPITNPQTTRRRGSTSGPAFGQTNQTTTSGRTARQGSGTRTGTTSTRTGRTTR